jgi:hypothetical protein
VPGFGLDILRIRETLEMVLEIFRFWLTGFLVHKFMVHELLQVETHAERHRKTSPAHTIYL